MFVDSMRIIPCPEVTVVSVEPTEYYVKRVHPRCVDVPIRKITLVEDDPLETDVHSASSGMDSIARHEVF
jgi:hypothetical protein